ncbi:hypothetical protein E6H31_04355 [Candidatus Bathyarchaeota archaeon]|nr:MAG: hypothetical protein E6H31_04355 [Candidatus Bathyarchaeota archaeon]
MGLEYVLLAPGFVKEVLDACEGWEGKGAMPTRLQELMLVLQIETDRRYKPRPPLQRKTEPLCVQQHLKAR